MSIMEPKLASYRNSGGQHEQTEEKAIYWSRKRAAKRVRKRANHGSTRSLGAHVTMCLYIREHKRQNPVAKGPSATEQ